MIMAKHMPLGKAHTFNVISNPAIAPLGRDLEKATCSGKELQGVPSQGQTSL